MDFLNRRRIDPADVRDRTMANTFYDRLQEQISAAQAQLYEGEQLAVYYQGQGGSPIQVTNLGYHNPLPDQALWQERKRRRLPRPSAYELGAVAARCREDGCPKPEADHRLRWPIISGRKR